MWRTLNVLLKTPPLLVANTNKSLAKRVPDFIVCAIWNIFRNLNHFFCLAACYNTLSHFNMFRIIFDFFLHPKGIRSKRMCSLANTCWMIKNIVIFFECTRLFSLWLFSESNQEADCIEWNQNWRGLPTSHFMSMYYISKILVRSVRNLPLKISLFVYQTIRENCYYVCCSTWNLFNYPLFRDALSPSN